MPPQYRVLAVVGSLRRGSHSSAVLHGLVAASPNTVEYEFADIGAIPHFNQDSYVEPLPEAVTKFRDQIARSNGLVISSPEYNHGIPGVLKNALDWASRPHNDSPLRGKSVLIMTSSPAFTGGARAQYQIRETLVSALARPVSTPEIVVGLVAAKLNDGVFRDKITIDFAVAGLQTMLREIELAKTEDLGTSSRPARP